MRDFWKALARAAEDGTGGGAATTGAAGAGEPKSPESVLFPNEGKTGEGKTDEGGKEPDKPAGEADWKEYVNDPAKSAEDNAAAKAEHDKTKPAADDKKANDKKADPADAVPADGKYALTMPEGVEVDAALLDALSPEFKAAGLTTKAAQKLADEFIRVQKERGEKQMADWAATTAGWVDDAKKDSEIGGDKWDGSVRNARRAVETYGTPALREYLDATGGGNHPELIRFMAKVGATVREDKPAIGGAGGSGRPAEAAHVLFPNDVPKGG